MPQPTVKIVTIDGVKYAVTAGNVLRTKEEVQTLLASVNAVKSATDAAHVIEAATLQAYIDAFPGT